MPLSLEEEDVKEGDVNRLSKVLGLRRCIIGLRFLYFKRDYIEENIPEYGRKTSYCMMVKHAMERHHFKACGRHFGCRCAMEALGLSEEMDCVESGQRYYSLRLYESRAVAKEVTRSIARIRQKIYGISLGPLEEMEDADLVLMLLDPYQLMRIVQGYAYKWGAPKKLSMAGNQGFCADLTAAPFENNDMNFSVLCAGSRKMCSWEDYEMGVGLPIQKFTPLTEGVIQTMNYIDYPDRKAEIRARLSSEDELGELPDDRLHYGRLGREYTRPELYEKIRGRDGNPECAPL